MDLIVGRGRVGRLTYFGTNVLLVVAGAVGYRLLSDRDAFTGEYDLTTESAVLLGVIGWLSVMNVVRRLHDRGHSGLMAFLFLVPFVGLAVALYLLFAPGSPGWNRFGPGAPGTPATPLDQVAHVEAEAAARRNQPFLTDDGSFDVDGLFRDSDIDRR